MCENDTRPKWLMEKRRLKNHDKDDKNTGMYVGRPRFTEQTSGKTCSLTSRPSRPSRKTLE